MESESRLDLWMSQASEWLGEQQWYQQLRGRWDELDRQSQNYLKFAAIGAGILLFIIILLSSVLSVRSLKHDLSERNNLLNTIQTAGDELHRLKESNPQAPRDAAATGGSWPSYIETVASNAGLDKSSLSISAEKPGASSDISKEALLDVGVKHASIKQVVRLAFYLESGARPMKLRNLAIDTKADPQGYLDATLSLSAFTMNPTNK
ncbi:MAG: hypothetical protein ACXWPM_00310 [Bdellovibrionota bacterium]